MVPMIVDTRERGGRDWRPVMSMGPFRLWRLKPSAEVAASVLGPLESRVMDVVWGGRAELSVREVHGTLGGTVAYTTVMTTLDRLFKKGLLARRRQGRAFLYAATASREQLGRSLAGELVVGLLGHGREVTRPLLSSLVDAVGEQDRRLLDELDRLVREKRRQLQGGATG